MAYDEKLAQRLREVLMDRTEILEKRMFGGACFFLRGNLLCGTQNDCFMFRVGKQLEAEALKRPGAEPLGITGKKMGGIVQVAAKTVSARALEEWIDLSERFVGELPKK